MLIFGYRPNLWLPKVRLFCQAPFFVLQPSARRGLSATWSVYLGVQCFWFLSSTRGSFSPWLLPTYSHSESEVPAVVLDANLCFFAGFSNICSKQRTLQLFFTFFLPPKNIGTTGKLATCGSATGKSTRTVWLPPPLAKPGTNKPCQNINATEIGLKNLLGDPSWW